MPYEPSPADETELDGLSVLLPDQEGVLIGRVQTAGADDGLAAYYVHWRRHIVLGEYGDGEFTPVSTFEHESQVMADQVRALTALDVEVTLSTIGRELLKAWHVADLTPLGTKEAHVYALRELGGFSRQRTAEILNVAPSTVDSHLQVAKRKQQEARNLLSLNRWEESDQTAPNHDSTLAEIIDEINDPLKAQ